MPKAYDYRKVTDAAANELTQEKRQEFMDYIWQGKTLGVAQSLTGISFDAALGVMNMNIEKQHTLTLRKESK